MKFSLISSILCIASSVAKDAEVMNLMQVMIIGEDGQLERTVDGEDFREMLRTERQEAIYDYVADLEIQANEIIEAREQEAEPVNLMTVVVIGEDGQIEGTHDGEDFREMLRTERQEAIYDFVADLEVQANEIMETREAEAEPVNLMTVYVIGEDGQLESTHSGDEFREMLRTERQEAIYDYVADLEAQVNEQVAAQQAAEPAVNLHNIGRDYMASALDESAFENPFMEAYFQVKSEDLTMDDILLDITRMQQEREAQEPNIADDFLGFGSYEDSQSQESDPHGLGLLPFNLQEDSGRKYEFSIGLDSEIFGQQGADLFTALRNEVHDDVRANIREMELDEQARVYAEAQQTEEALNAAINHIWGSVTIDGQDLDEVVERPIINFAANLVDNSQQSEATAYYAITGTLAISAFGILAAGVLYMRQQKKEAEVSDDYEQAAEP